MLRSQLFTKHTSKSLPFSWCFNPKCICYKDSPQGVTRGWICLFKSSVYHCGGPIYHKKMESVSRECIYTDEHKRAPATESNRLMKRRKIQQRREKTTSLDTELKTLNTQDKAGFFLAAGWSWSSHCQTNMIITLRTAPLHIPDCIRFP